MKNKSIYLPVAFFVLLMGATNVIAIAQLDSVKQDEIVSDTLLIKSRKEKTLDSLDKVIGKKTIELSKSFVQQNLTQKQLPPKGLTPISLKDLPSESVKRERIEKRFKPFKIVASTFSSLNHNATHGNISVGYDYGVVPFVSNGAIANGYLRMDGNMSLKLFSFPVNVSFFYSDIKSVSGLTNYFRLVYDQNKFKQEIRENISAQTEGVKTEINSLYTEKQKAYQKLYQLKSFSVEDIDIPNNTLPGISSDKSDIIKGASFEKLNAATDFKQLDKLTGTLTKHSDSLPNLLDSTDISNKIAYPKEEYSSIPYKLKSKTQKADSINDEIKKYESKLKEYETKINALNTKLETLKNPKDLANYTKTNNRYLKKAVEIFSHIKTLEIGMCYPSYSTFLVTGVAVKGLNVEYRKNDFFLAFTHGTTVNNMLFTTNAIQNRISNTQNLFNFFDFNYSGNGRRITAVKFGYGQKEETHLYLGLLYGIGMPNYLSNTIISSTSIDRPMTPDKNFVSELDGRYVFKKDNTLDIVYGKSSIQTKSQYFNSGDVGFNSLLTAKQSNAVMGKYSLKIKTTKTKLTITGRWVDPFFKSYGVGFMRSDNFRYELKTEQQLGAKIKFTGFYRRDEDNLLSLYNYKNILQTLGSNLSIKVRRSLYMRLGFNPVVQRVLTTDNSYFARNINSISNVVLTYNPSLKHGSTTFNIMYNYYHLTTGGQTSRFENITITNLTQFKKAFKNNFNAGCFRTSGSDSLNNNTWLFTDELGYLIKQGASITGGLKAAYNPVAKWQYGFLVKVSVPVIRHVNFELSAERLVMGDFYNSLNFEQISKFPYYCNTKLLINW